jgi:uncharacterized protein (DUF433 family)
MAMQVSFDERIESTPGVCGGKPRIAGYRIRVQDIVGWYEYHEMTPDEIVAGYPQITLADVHAALAYYQSHRDEIQQQMSDDEAFVASLQRCDARQSSNGTDAHGNPTSSW